MQPTLHKQTSPYDIDEIYDELMEGKVKEIIEIEIDHDLYSINSPIVNTGKINRDGIYKHSEKLLGKFEYKPRNNQYKLRDNQYKPRDNNHHTWNNYQ